MKIGDIIDTPRFTSVRIRKILTQKEALEKGFTEPTHYRDPQYDIFGKVLDRYHVIFAAVKKEG